MTHKVVSFHNPDGKLCFLETYDGVQVQRNPENPDNIFVTVSGPSNLIISGDRTYKCDHPEAYVALTRRPIIVTTQKKF